MKKHLEDTERSRSAEYQYLNLLKDILKNGSDKPLFFTPEVLDQYKKKGEEPPFIRSVFGRQMGGRLLEQLATTHHYESFSKKFVIKSFLNSSSINVVP